jgi:hypothetical protein
MQGRVYPVLDPPTHLTNLGDHRSWSIELAQENYNWVMSVRKRRVDSLLEFFGYALPEKGRENDFLISLGEEVGVALCTEPNNREVAGKKELTAPGLSMAYDMGLLIGQLLITASEGTVRWALFRAEPLSPEFNLPVLIGRREDWEIGVNRVCIVKAKAILRGEKSGDVWAIVYRNWHSELNSARVTPTRLRPGSKLSHDN